MSENNELITEKEYEDALDAKTRAERTINKYQQQKNAEFRARYQKYMDGEDFFNDDELTYSANFFCPCGNGAAYPKGCDTWHHWECSAILKGVADRSVTHMAKHPFAFYSIKTESEHNGTTRGRFKPMKGNEGAGCFLDG